MDFDKIIKFAETYLQGYFLSIADLLLQPFAALPPQPVAAPGPDTDGRKWVFAVISIELGSLALSYAVGSIQKITDIPIITVFFTLWLWILFAVIAHLFARLVGGTADFFRTLDVCLLVLPTIYVISSLGALTVAVFSDLRAEEYVGIFFLLIQFVLLSIYLTPAVKRTHHISGFKGTVVIATLPFIVLIVNTFFLVLYLIYLGISILTSPTGPRAPGTHFSLLNRDSAHELRSRVE